MASRREQADLMATLIDQLLITISTFKNTEDNYRIIFKNKFFVFYVFSKVGMIFMKLCIHWVTEINAENLLQYSPDPSINGSKEQEAGIDQDRKRLSQK